MALPNYEKISNVENFQNKVNFNETIGEYNNFTKSGKVVTICYQGENKIHNTNDLLFTLPVGYRPSKVCPTSFSGYGNVYGNIWVYQNGECKIGNINSSSISARISFSIAYMVE